jgi:hypothetical protein
MQLDRVRSHAGLSALKSKNATPTTRVRAEPQRLPRLHIGTTANISAHLDDRPRAGAPRLDVDTPR